jgi:hypothetical protein
LKKLLSESIKRLCLNRVKSYTKTRTKSRGKTVEDINAGLGITTAQQWWLGSGMHAFMQGLV